MRGIFDIDNWMEILSTIKKNKLRTFLTGFSVAWGIFMLIILLASGNGLKNGVISNFGDRAINTIEIWPRRTSMPYQGNSSNRRISLDQKDYDLLDTQFKEVDEIVPRTWANTMASYNFESINCNFEGVYPEEKTISGIKIKDNKGRFINDADMKERRKVAVINKRMKEALFKDEDPLGKMITSNSLNFKVIGVYEGNEWGNQNRAYVPFTTAQLLYNRGWGFGSISFSINGLETKEANENFEKGLRKKLASLHQFHPDDTRAIGMYNSLENYLQTMGIFNGINFFVWIIGIGTLIAGVVGVSNIMLITVRERTREFGIRKALGAKPASILQLILMESILITSVFGYIGMVFGIGLSELINYGMEMSQAAAGGDREFSIFRNPTVDLAVAGGATILLVCAGVIAGYFPARKAVKVTAVEAMRAE
ncbi:ABC transporter permease [Bacteroidia bacterium]|nr:ABC transporter permease [Bacteroidia bacterium]GHV20518.1 ABC transporter permease [Bacteroidia bacterium]